MRTIYLAGGLFNAGERLHLLHLEKHLKTLHYTVILPQREAKRFMRGGLFDLAGLVAHCREQCTFPEVIYVGCLDGPDADSGMAVEYGLVMGNQCKAVVYRTDFRTAVEHELGVNAMFGIAGTQLVYAPCRFTELDQVAAYYHELAAKIHEAIRKTERVAQAD